MQPEVNTEYIKYSIKRYLRYEDLIKLLKYQKENYSRYFYATSSFTGGMHLQDADDDYCRAIRPDYGAMVIVAHESLLSRLIEKVTRRAEKFDEYLLDKDREALQDALELDYLTNLERDVYDEIQEIEYYVSKHAMNKIRIENNQYHVRNGFEDTKRNVLEMEYEEKIAAEIIQSEDELLNKIGLI